ncbi:cytochrome P450 315a1, mitochondrial isoform X2 [Lepeophtheirus salmonis]|uniref:cytochrome P450 315a1, mitochondrial isoform X2 n=1 Tax=Lepeophtheirus salmonis TaxID=72036 RepID=UPI001AEB1C3D|nr:cytochrome P450 315a1, mitochondrial-like isoform X2 [Lepeophtheirus salmonis]
MSRFCRQRLYSTIPRVGEFIEKIKSSFLQDPERIGPDVDALFIADPEIVRKIFSLESKYPKHFIPQAWSVYGDMRNRKRGLFFLDGPEWLRMRRVLNPILLNNDSVHKFVPFFEKEARRFLNNVEANSSPPPSNSSQKYGTFKNLPIELHRWSVRSILAVIFGDSNILSEEEEEGLIEDVQIIFDISARLQFTSALESCRQNTPDWIDFSSAADRVFELLNKSIKNTNVNSKSLSGVLISQGVSYEDVERIAMDFVIAAVDTTSISTLWILHLISQDTYIQNEIRTSFDNQLLRNCMREASRLYPVSPFITRVLDKDILIEGSKLRTGQLILFSIYTMSRNPNYFTKPEHFMPQRWDITPSSFASIPFGFRARSCIGKKLAELSMETLIKGLIQRYKIHCLNYEKAEMIMKFIGLPDRTIKIGLEHIV